MLTKSDLETRVDLLFRLLSFEVGPHIKPLFPPTPKPEPTRKLDVALHAQGASALCPPGMQPAPPAIATPGAPQHIVMLRLPSNDVAKPVVPRLWNPWLLERIKGEVLDSLGLGRTQRPSLFLYPWRHHHQEASSGFTANQGGKLAATRETRRLLQDLSLESKQPKRV